MKDEDFTNALIILRRGSSTEEMADKLLVSAPTVRRWTKGKNLPGYSMRQSILEILVK